MNKRQTQFIEDLKAKLVEHEIYCPLYVYKPKENKLERIKDQLETVMSQK